jgi:hypothetical protein
MASIVIIRISDSHHRPVRKYTYHDIDAAEGDQDSSIPGGNGEFDHSAVVSIPWRMDPEIVRSTDSVFRNSGWFHYFPYGIGDDIGYHDFSE